MEEFAGVPWIFVAIGFVVAGLAMAYGVIQTRKRRRPLDARTEEEKARRLVGQK